MKIMNQKQEEVLKRIFNELIENKTSILNPEDISFKKITSFISKLSSMINNYYEVDFDDDFEYYFVDYKIVEENKIKLILERVTVMYNYG